MWSGFTTANARPDLIVRAAARAVSVFAPAQAGALPPDPQDISSQKIHQRAPGPRGAGALIAQSVMGVLLRVQAKGFAKSSSGVSAKWLM